MTVLDYVYFGFMFIYRVDFKLLYIQARLVQWFSI